MLGIAIVTYNRLETLQACVEAVRRHTQTEYQLVVCDDGSPDGTAAWCREQGIPVIAGENRGVAWNKNRGLFYLSEVCGCDPILLLEEDCHPTEDGWEAPWIAAAERYGHVNYAKPEQLHEGSDWARWVNGVCTITTRDALRPVGYLDTRFRGYGAAHTEHTDRFRRRGLIVGQWPVEGYPSLRHGVELVDAGTYYDPEVLARNRAIRETLAGEPEWRPAARTGEEAAELAAEVLRALPGRGWLPADLDTLYGRYVATVPRESFCISRDLAGYLWLLLRAWQPKTILDVGSGFSTALFQHYARTAPAQVVSVETDPEWLGKTKRFLWTEGLSEGVQFAGTLPATGEFDLVLHDLGGHTEREAAVPQVLARVRPLGLAIFDDAQRGPLRAALKATGAGFALRSRRPETRDRHGRYAWTAARGADPTPLPRPLGQVAVVTLLTQEKAYVLPQLLASFRALLAPPESSLRFVVVQAGELAPEHVQALEVFRAEYPLEWVTGPEVDRREGDPWWRSLVAAELRERARESLQTGGDDWVFWVDCDVLNPPDTLLRLSTHGRALVSGLVLNRVAATPICGWHRSDSGEAPPPDLSAPVPVEVGWVGFGCFLTRGDLVREISYQPYLSGEAPPWTGEDGYWCERAYERSGERVLLDAGLCPWHVDERGVGVAASWPEGRLGRRLKLFFGGEGGYLIPRISGDSPRFGLMHAGQPFHTDARGRALPTEEMRALAARSQYLDFVEPAGG